MSRSYQTRGALRESVRRQPAADQGDGQDGVKQAHKPITLPLGYVWNVCRRKLNRKTAARPGPKAEREAGDGSNCVIAATNGDGEREAPQHKNCDRRKEHAAFDPCRKL